MNLKLIASTSFFILSTIIFSQDEDEKVPLWIEKGETILSIKPNATMMLKSQGKSSEEIMIKYVDVDHGKREIYYKLKSKSDILAHKFDDIEYFKPLKKGVPYATKVVSLSGLVGAGLGYYMTTSDKSFKDSEKTKAVYTAFSGAIITGFIGSYLFSEKRPYISSFVYIEDGGEAVREFPEFIRIEKNEWKIIE
tara:strand:+ start:556 stop:1137 length:582 start_codon:yes stop_codon:yes gene_type:complete